MATSDSGTDLTLKTSETVTCTVGPSGSNVRVSDCFVCFPPGAFDEDANVEFKLELDSSKWPKGFIGITPTVYVRADKPLQSPATVKVSSWCKNDGSRESQCTDVYVLHGDGSDEWELAHTLDFLDDLEFKTSCMDFTPLFVAIKEGMIGPQYLLLDAYLFATDQGKFAYAIGFKSNLVHDEIMKVTEKRDLHLKLNFNTVCSKKNDKMVAKIECTRPSGYSFEPTNQFPFMIDDTFICVTNFVIFDSVLGTDEYGVHDVILRCDILKNDVIVDENRCFRFVFRNKQERGGEPPTTHYYSNKGNSSASFVDREGLTDGEDLSSSSRGGTSSIRFQDNTWFSLRIIVFVVFVALLLSVLRKYFSI